MSKLTLSGHDEPPRVVASRAPEVDIAAVHMADLDAGSGYRACVAVFGTEEPKVTERDATDLIAGL
jgi:4'-phosphopantetheinyl transferase